MVSDRMTYKRTRRPQAEPQHLPDKRSQRFRQLILDYLGQVKSALLLALLCMVGVTVTELLSPWPLKIIVDNILLGLPLPAPLAFLNGLFQSNQFASLLLVVSVIVLLSLLEGSLSYLQTVLTSRAGNRLVYILRCELFSHIQRLPLSFHNQARRGEVLTKISSDTTVLKEVFGDDTLSVVTHALTIVGMFVVMFLLDWQLSLVVLATFPVLLLVFVRLRRDMKQSARQQRKKEGKIASQLSEVLSAVPVVQAFAREGYEERRFEEENAQNLENSVRMARMDAAASRATELISAIGRAMVIFLAAWKAFQGEMSPGDVLIFATYMKQLFKPVRKIVTLSAKLAKASVSTQRIGELLDITPDIADYPWAIPATNLRWGISFQDVSFRYTGGEAALHDVSFVIRPGQRVALVGASGAGKTTIINLLLRLYEPQQGVILIDGVPLAYYQRASLRREIGLVLQNSILFGATVAENISYGKPEATRQEIETAARQAYAHDFIMRLPEGYDTVIGEMGSTLSGGQRQRIAIARALIKQPSMLILDEPTSSLDVESQQVVRETINRLQQGKTTIVIAHDLESIRDFDLILVMKDGRLIDCGTHQQLMAQRGYYSELVQRQALSTQ